MGEKIRGRDLMSTDKSPAKTPSIILTIGLLDRCLSGMILLAQSDETDEADRQTLRHHAEDVIGAAQKVLKVLSQHRAVERIAIEEDVAELTPIPDLYPPRDDGCCPDCGSSDVLDASQSLSCLRCDRSW